MTLATALSTAEIIGENLAFHLLTLLLK